MFKTNMLVVAVTPVMLAIVGPARASTITFETATYGDFAGAVTENGFTYSTLTGNLFVNDWGDPGQDMEGSEALGGGVLDIVSATAGDFFFSNLDYSAYSDLGAGTQTLTVSGFLNGTLVGTDTYTLANTNVFFPTYANWTLESASNLAGVKIDDLQITLPAGVSSAVFQENIDNVTLFAAAPEPTAWALMLVGFAGLGGVLRARRGKLAAA